MTYPEANIIESLLVIGAVSLILGSILVLTLLIWHFWWER
jgi:hypothetical protein